jgi:hypothetical protein
VQAAIEKIANDEKHNITIIMIAHRISTIKSAKNLLYLEDNSSVLAAVKGTPEYDSLIDRLLQQNYAHQKDIPVEVDEVKIDGFNTARTFTAATEEDDAPMTKRALI